MIFRKNQPSLRGNFFTAVRYPRYNSSCISVYPIIILLCLLSKFLYNIPDAKSSQHLSLAWKKANLYLLCAVPRGKNFSLNCWAGLRWVLNKISRNN